MGELVVADMATIALLLGGMKLQRNVGEIRLVREEEAFASPQGFVNCSSRSTAPWSVASHILMEARYDMHVLQSFQQTR